MASKESYGSYDPARIVTGVDAYTVSDMITYLNMYRGGEPVRFIMIDSKTGEQAGTYDYKVLVDPNGPTVVIETRGLWYEMDEEYKKTWNVPTDPNEMSAYIYRMRNRGKE